MTDLSTLSEPCPLSGYTRLVIAADRPYSVTLSQEEGAVVLKAYDYGVDRLSGHELGALNRVIAKLKEAVWP